MIRGSKADSLGTQTFCSEANETNARGAPRPMPGAPEKWMVKHCKELHSNNDQRTPETDAWGASEKRTVTGISHLALIRHIHQSRLGLCLSVQRIRL